MTRVSAAASDPRYFPNHDHWTRDRPVREIERGFAVDLVAELRHGENEHDDHRYDGQREHREQALRGVRESRWQRGGSRRPRPQ